MSLKIFCSECSIEMTYGSCDFALEIAGSTIWEGIHLCKSCFDKIADGKCENEDLVGRVSPMIVNLINGNKEI